MEKLLILLFIRFIKLMIANAVAMFVLLFVAYVIKSEVYKIDLIPNFTVNPLEIAKELKWAKDFYFYLAFTLELLSMY